MLSGCFPISTEMHSYSEPSITRGKPLEMHSYSEPSTTREYHASRNVQLLRTNNQSRKLAQDATRHANLQPNLHRIPSTIVFHLLSFVFLQQYTVAQKCTVSQSQLPPECKPVE